MEREFDVDLLKVVGARLKRDYAVPGSALPDAIASQLAKLRCAELTRSKPDCAAQALPPRHGETASED